MSYQTIRVRMQEPVCFIQLYRPDRNNTIDDQLVNECHQVLAQCEESATTVVVLEGLPEVFCFGADFQGLRESSVSSAPSGQDPEVLYGLWEKLASGPYITIAHVRGKANAGGIGFVAACDIVLADETAQFSLSELLFGLMPACVLPFLIRRLGFQKAHYLTVMTQPISVQQAMSWGLVDAYEKESDALLRRHLIRLRRLSKRSVKRYKQYMNQLHGDIQRWKPLALAANREIFSDRSNLEGIFRYVETGLFPWEK